LLAPVAETEAETEAAGAETTEVPAAPPPSLAAAT